MSSYQSKYTGKQVEDVLDNAILKKEQILTDNEKLLVKKNLGITEPDLSDYATKKDVEDAVSSIPTPDVSGQIEEHNNDESAHPYIQNELEKVNNSIPTSVSQLDNDSNFVTEDTVSELIRVEFEKLPEQDVSGQISAALVDYVKKVEGKGLSTNDFTDELKQTLEDISNYDLAEIEEEVDKLETTLNTLVSGDASQAIESFNEIIAFLKNVSDTESLSGIIAGINARIAEVEAKIPTKVSELENDKNYLTEHQSLSNLATKDELKSKQDIISDLANIREGAAKGATAIQEEQYKGTIAAVDTDESVDDPNIPSGSYDDTEIKEQIANLETEVSKKADEADTASKLSELGSKVDALATGGNTINDIISKQKIENVSGKGFTFTQNADGGILKLEKSAGKGNAGGAYIYVNFALNDNVYWKAGHEYYCAVDIYVSLDSLSSNGRQSFNIQPKFSDPNSIGSYQVEKQVSVGQRGLYKTKIKVNDSISEEHIKANRLFFQLDKRYDTNSSYRAVIYQVFVVDLGIAGADEYIDWSYIDEIVESKGLGYVNAVDSALKSAYSDVAGVAKETEKVKTKDIELWGDSLTAQNYGRFILGADVYTHGYGGQTSTYIRDKFLSEFNEDRTQVIWVGRNNYNEVDVVVDDVRDMVSALGTDDFVIMCPPNGQWGSFGTNGEDGTGEMKGGDSYKNFLEIERRLAAEYPSNFLNIRKAVIEGWRMGNVKLLSDFVQPSIGDNVTIEVSDATFLTTYNSSDVTAFGDDFMSKIRIGLNGKYDVYKVIEKVDNTHLTVQLEEVNRITSGSAVGNIADRGETASIKYLRVMQNADYMCWLYDTTLSTFRNDGIHMATKGIKLVADIVSRKLSSMGLLYRAKIEYINFADPLVKQLLIDNGISGDGIGITNADALAPLNFGTIFTGNTEITSFDECANFKSIDTMYGFDGCTSLRSIVFGEKVYKINNNAFKNCTSLQSVTGASNVTEIWNDAFNGCEKLSRIDLDWSKIEHIGQRTFMGCLSLPNTDLNIPNAKSIENSAFNNSSITKISDLGEITGVNQSCFANCANLIEANLHDGITTLGNSAFERCGELKYIVVPDSVTAIGSYCFQYDRKLESVVLGVGLQTIGDKVFSSCDALKTIISKAVAPPSVGGNVFAYVTLQTIYVPDESVDAYKAAGVWSTYADRIKGISEMPS